MLSRKKLNIVLTLGVILVVFVSLGFSTADKSDKLKNDDSQLEFNSDGLYFAEFYDYIFRGHFENIEMKREDTQFLMIFEQYLRTFGRQCPSSLPSDKVEIMEDVCAAEQVTTNGYGVETSRVCVEWVTVGSGLYARPDLYNAKLNVERLQSVDALRNVMAMISDPNAIGNSLDMIHKAKGLNNDMSQLFSLNNCKSAGVRRFEENLKLFALNQASIRMKGSSKYAAVKESGGPTGPQNFDKLIDDLVANQSTTWAFNRYQAGSISGVTIRSKDSQGRPSELQANYRYSSFGGASNGWVRITFTNGLPKCIYFFDFPANCKSPNSSIVAYYAQGRYSK